MIPKYLYHYTDVKSLIKIIKSNKIRFTRLDKLEDYYEGYFYNEQNNFSSINAKKFIYCSCWNACSTESNLLWKSYSKNDETKGVRIKVRSNLFSNKLEITELSENLVFKQVIQPFKFNDQVSIKSVLGPIEVKYVNSPEEIDSQNYNISTVNKGTNKEFEMVNINLKEMGLKKLSNYSSEKEWRFIICPFIAMHSSVKITGVECENCIEFLDIPLYNNIEEIVLSPKFDNSELNKLQKFLSLEGISIPITKSKIKMNNN